MTTLFDFVTVGSFFGLVLAFFFWTERDVRTLLHFSVSAIVLAVANQTGNAGYSLFAAILVAAGVAYAAIAIYRSDP